MTVLFIYRENLVKSLSKYIKVDVYGSCGTLTCARDQEDSCNQLLNETYKFYLSLENSVCQVMAGLNSDF